MLVTGASCVVHAFDWSRTQILWQIVLCQLISAENFIFQSLFPNRVRLGLGRNVRFGRQKKGSDFYSLRPFQDPGW
jgi:hypothetical protein